MPNSSCNPAFPFDLPTQSGTWSDVSLKLKISSSVRLSLSTVVLNSRDRQGMYGMQHFRAPINKPHNSL